MRSFMVTALALAILVPSSSGQQLIKVEVSL